ncbi:BMP family ABC transporter substrate-binding protein [Parasedimentitalea psychrophila]|uniref:BMP family ABC transporter substrate-binding protein n=1 Tax=Parasedimentitalea psychrophila TaxID=2997337 RepID=A0A9Y2L124_9RHOB|nr:BMP family ABC transporter substrate-binding protein [Parasedimentitalea psychrophila]WIY26353.1 BMP family ABC transporter substrate-binding protein [Parasedimentitalea psychrophila]
MKLTTLLTSAAMALGLATVAVAADKTKVGFVFVGPVGDGGWTYEHNQGRLAVEEAYGDKVETVYVENVAEGPDAERVMTQMALEGADLIFTTSFGYMDPTINVAKKFPNVKFEHATGYKRADNVSTYSARFYEGRAVQGTIAGSMTESNIVGYIGSYPIPEVIRGINSAYIHAKKVNPDVQFKIVWAFTWFDPAKEADAAKVLIEQGADVILQHTDSTAPQAAAQAAGNVITFGQASDMSEYGPKPRVSSIIDNWAPYYLARTQAVMDGTWTSVDTWDGIGAGMVGIGEISDAVPADVKSAALALQASLADGSYHAFTGPVNKQDGSVWLADGETADDGTLAGMNFFVEGIEGDIPQ